jgi:PGF-CTERM protein
VTRALLTTLVLASIVAGVVAGSGAAADADASLVARHPAENGSMTETAVVTAEDVASAEPTTTQHGQPGVAVTLTDEGAQSFTDTLVDAGFTSDDATGNCPADGAERNDEGYCLLTVLDGEVVYAAALSPSLADAIEGGALADDPQLLLATATESNATRLAEAFGASVSENTTTERTQTPATSDSAENATATTNTTGTSVPGFGVVAALLAVALAAGVLSRR